jgi:hypothetical protein
MRRKPPYTHKFMVTMQLRNPLTGKTWEAWSTHKTRELAERRVDTVPTPDSQARRSATCVRDSYSITPINTTP